MAHKKLCYGIIGLGRFGEALARELAMSDADIMVLDKNEDIIKEFKEYTENAFVVHSLDKRTLEESGIHNCDVVIVCFSEQLDTSILTVLNLIQLGTPKVIAKSASAEHGEILKKLGAEVVYPERDMAIRTAHRLENTKMLDFVQLGEKIHLSKLVIPTSLIGKSIMDSRIRANYGLNIITIEKEGCITASATPDYVFEANDIIYVAGEKDGLMRLSQLK